MITISQILYDQYHIWDIFGLGLKVFLLKKTTENGNHGEGTQPNSYNPNYGNGVFGNVYLSAGQHYEVNIAGTPLLQWEL